MKINLGNTQREAAEKIIIEGKIRLFERDNEDLKIKIKRYEDNSQKLLEELNSLTNERNKLLNKVDEMTKNPQISAIPNRSRTGLSIKNNRSGFGTTEMGPINLGIFIFMLFAINIFSFMISLML